MHKKLKLITHLFLSLQISKQQKEVQPGVATNYLIADDIGFSIDVKVSK